jgi:hypothetical protein
VSRVRRGLLAAIVVVAMAACAADPSTAPSASPDPTGSPVPSTSPITTPAATSIEPSPTPAPTLSLDLPAARDGRSVSASVATEVGAEGGEIVVTVTSVADTRIDDLVLRWPTALGDTLVLAPFVPSDDRIRDGGPPLVQPWTKWVVGPGERGEPAGTISLGYGPLLPGAQLQVRLFVTRVAPGPIGFDLQLLAGNDLLMLDGDPAELRVEIP